MNCEKFRDNITALLAGELDERSSHALRQHADTCPDCAEAMRSTSVLVDTLKSHPDRNIPEAVEARVLDGLKALRQSQQHTTASPLPLLSRIRGAFTMKRSLIAAGLVAVVIAIGLGLLPSNKGNAVLAQVADAMASVRTVHLTGYEINYDGERCDFEMWIKQPSRYRIVIREGRGFGEIVDDGKQKILLSKGSAGWSYGKLPSGEPGQGYGPPIPPVLKWFNKEGMLNMTTAGIIDSHRAALPDGRTVQIIELAGVDLNAVRSVIAIDEATDMIVQVEDYLRGKLTRKIEHIDYNVALPDSMFEIKIPKGATVNEDINPIPPSPEEEARHRKINDEMEAEGGKGIANLKGGNGCGSPAHSSLRFTILTDGPTYIYYFKSRNAYRIFGKAKVTDTRKRGYVRVVEDGWFTAPYKSDEKPETRGTFQMRIDKPGRYRKFILPDDRGYNGFGAERIQNIDSSPLLLTMEGSNVIFHGEARIYPQGAVYHDGQSVPIDSIRTYGPGDEYDLAKAEFGNLPASEVRTMKADMQKHNRAWRQYYYNQEAAREKLPEDAEVCFNCGPGYRVQSGAYFMMDPDAGLTLYYIPSRDSIYVAGRAKMVTRRFYRRVETIVENEEVQAPGPEYRKYHEERQKEQKQRDEYNKQKPGIRFDEWLKQHPELQ